MKFNTNHQPKVHNPDLCGSIVAEEIVSVPPTLKEKMEDWIWEHGDKVALGFVFACFVAMGIIIAFADTSGGVGGTRTIIIPMRF